MLDGEFSVVCMCRLYVDVDGWCMVDGYPCRIGAGIGAGIGSGIRAEESCRTSSCRIAVLEVSVKTVVPLLRMEHF